MLSSCNFFFLFNPFAAVTHHSPLLPAVCPLCQWSVASVHREWVGGVARLVDVSLLEATKPRLCCCWCKKPLHAGQHSLVQDTAGHRSQGRLPLWGETLTLHTSIKGKGNLYFHLHTNKLIWMCVCIFIFFNRDFWIFRWFVKLSKCCSVS